MKLNLFGWEFYVGKPKDIDKDYYEYLEKEEQQLEEVTEQQQQSASQEEEEIVPKSKLMTYKVNEDFSQFDLGRVVEITEEVPLYSPKEIRKMIDRNETTMTSLIEALKADYIYQDTYLENEEMSKDPIVGSAMELLADDVSIRDPASKKVVYIKSEDKGLAEFLNMFLEKNIKIEKRIWEWAYEIIKHGDFKLRRREYTIKRKSNSIESGEIQNSEQKKEEDYKGVFYENVVEGWKVSRIEYLGEVLGYLDEEEEDEKENRILKDPGSFVHFIDTKLPKRKKIKVRIFTGDEGNISEIDCVKVYGSSIVDNARYIFRIVRLLDDMLVMSRVARSSQFNLVKIEVGDAGGEVTQRILMDVKRRIEGSTRMQKGKGMRTDPSPIPLNANIYIPVRQGRGDVTIDTHGESVDVRSITDIDYFKSKLFATLRTPKAFLGFEEEMPGTMGNASLLRMDIRYSRTVQRAQNNLKSGIEELCNNYLHFRGRSKDIGKFEVVMRDVTHTEDDAMLNELLQRLSLVDSVARFAVEHSTLIDLPSILNYILSLIGFDVSEFAKGDLLKLLRGEYEPSTEPAEPQGGGEDDLGGPGGMGMMRW